MQLLDYVQNNMNNIIRLTIEHLQITGISIITAIVIGVPLGIIVTPVSYTHLDVYKRQDSRRSRKYSGDGKNSSPHNSYKQAR